MSRLSFITKTHSILQSLVALALIGSLSAAQSPGLQRRGTAPTEAEKSRDGLWEFVDPARVGPGGPAQHAIASGSAHRLARLNQDLFRNRAWRAPLEFSEAARTNPMIMTLPMPNGSFAGFEIRQSPIMAPDLAREFPEIQTWVGQGVDDPTATIRFDWTPAGLHAMILSPGRTIFVDPYRKGDTSLYLSYYKSDLRKEDNFQCFAGGSPFVSARKGPAGERKASVVGATLRTIRFAVAATGEYTAFHGGTVAGALAAITTTLNRVNGLYEKEFALRLILIGDENKIIYTDAATDPYTNDSASKLVDENQVNLDAVIGDTNYDLGHVFSTSPGGVGAEGLCQTGAKARGATGLDKPVGDPYDVGYVAHETIHQLNGNHTFNSTAPGCGADNRNAATAVEPGSGSTIASYVGLCGDYNLQADTEDYFNATSFEEVAAYIAGPNGACAKQIATGNRPPTVITPTNYRIPKLTPFALTASGSDPDGDTITYTWEQADIGAASPPEEDDGTRPIFRSFRGTTSPSRTFPRLVNILAGNNQPPASYKVGDVTFLTGEILPSSNRTMNFRVTLRDNRAGGGGVSNAAVQVAVHAAAGPFVVTSPNAAANWVGNSLQTITWDVADTNATPISAVNVRISLSLDGGTTFPIALATTANDGSEAITVPDLPTTRARIKVEAVGNIFFDISNADFTITASGIAPSVAHFAQFANGGGIASTLVLTNPSTTTTANGTVNLFDDPGQPLSVVLNGQPAASVVSFTIPPLGAVTLASDGLGTVVVGSVRVSSNTPLAGVVRFFVPGLGLAGVGESVPLTAMILPAARDAARGLSTGVAITNALDTEVQATLSLRSLQSGLEVGGGAAQITLAGKGHVAKFIHELFPNASTANFSGTLVVTATTVGGKVAATAIELGSLGGEFTTLPVVSVDPVPTIKELYFAQFANGAAFTSAVVLTNPQGAAITGEVSFFDDPGSPLPVSIGDAATPNKTSFTLAAKGGAIFTTDGQGTLKAGSARLTAASAVGGVLRFSAPGLGIAGVGSSTPMTAFITPVTRTVSGNLSTGIAVAAVSQGMTITLTLRTASGTAIAGGQVTRTLATNGHLAQFIQELFPNADTAEFSGTLTVTAESGTIVGTAIQLGSTAGQFTTLPVAAIR